MASAVRVVVDQIYSRAGGVPRVADIYLPIGGKTPVPVVIWLHGGGWRLGDRHLAPNLAHFAESSGCAVVSIDYRLSEEAVSPAAIEDAKTAVRWVRVVAKEFGFNGERIGFWGSSSGAHLAACAALSQEEDFLTDEYAGHSSKVRAVVDGYGPTNFGRIDAERSATAALGTDAESLGIGKVIPAGEPDSFESRFLGSAVADAPQLVELADPVHYVPNGNPPFLILHGQSDTLIPWSQSKYLFDALSTAGDDVVLVLFEKLGHGFFNHKALADEDYGVVTVHRSNHGRWECDSSENIPNMVVSFFKAYLGS